MKLERPKPLVGRRRIRATGSTWAGASAGLTALVLALGASSAGANNVTAEPGSPVTMTATAEGTTPFTYQWSKDGTVLSGANGETYQIASASAMDSGSYTVQVTNSAGSTVSESAQLTVASQQSAPEFTAQPESQTVDPGQSVTFTAAATGEPAPTYQWLKNGVAIQGAAGTSYTIESVTNDDAGSYSLTAANGAGTATSNAAVLTVRTSSGGVGGLFGRLLGRRK